MKPVVYVLQSIEDFNKKLEELFEEGYSFSSNLQNFEDFEIDEELRKDIVENFEFFVIYKDCEDFLYEVTKELFPKNTNKLEYDVIFKDSFHNNGFKNLTLEELIETFRDCEIDYI